MENIINDDYLASRFFLVEDFRMDNFIIDIPRTWWSRPYEYAWAANFAKKTDVVLDAASGICHPFKFYLSAICKSVYACDIDKRILSHHEILKEIGEVFGEKAKKDFPRKLLNNINYSNSSITKLPYKSRTFDKIFCLSVIEHLGDFFNRQYPGPLLTKLGDRLLNHDMLRALNEFSRMLTDDGKIILTFDYPTINLDYFKDIISQLKLSFAGEVSFQIPRSALHSAEHGLYCFRAVLKRNSIK